MVFAGKLEREGQEPSLSAGHTRLGNTMLAFFSRVFFLDPRGDSLSFRLTPFSPRFSFLSRGLNIRGFRLILFGPGPDFLNLKLTFF